MRVLVAEGSVVLDDTVVPIYVATVPYIDPDTDIEYLPRISVSSEVSFRSAARAWWMSGQASSGYGSLSLVNTDGSYDTFLQASYAQRVWVIREGTTDQAFSDMALVQRAYAEQMTFKDERLLQFSFNNGAMLLEKPVQAHTFPTNGSGTPVGATPPNEDLRGEVIPLLAGRVRQVPLLLWDDTPASGGNEYIIAGNVSVDPTETGVLSPVREGGKPINEGAGSGEFQVVTIGAGEYAPIGIDLNDQPTLPVTVEVAHRYKSPFPYWITHFGKFTTYSGSEVPDGYLFTNWSNGSRYLERVEGESAIAVYVPGGVTPLRMDMDTSLLPGTGTKTATYRITAYVRQPVGGAGVLLMRFSLIDASYNVLHAGSQHSVNVSSSRVYVTTLTNTSTSAAWLRAEFARIGSAGDVVVEKITVEQLDEVEAAPEHVIPYVLCELGNVAPITGVSEERYGERGPLHAYEVDTQALDTLVADGLIDADIGHYWQGTMTHKEFLELACTSLDLIYWWTPSNVLTFAKVDVPTDEDDDIDFTVSDYNRTSAFNIQSDGADKLTGGLLDGRRYRVLTESEVAQDLTPAQQSYYMRKWTRRHAATLDLHEDYLGLVDANKDRETIISWTSGGAPAYAISFYEVRRSFVVVDVVLSGNQFLELQPNDKILLTSSSERYDFGDLGAKGILLDIDNSRTRGTARLVIWAPTKITSAKG